VRQPARRGNEESIVGSRSRHRVEAAQGGRKDDKIRIVAIESTGPFRESVP
jgi:hypothetical protein